MASTIHLEPQVLSIISGVAIPIVVAAITKLNASPALKALLNALLATIAGAAATALASGGTIAWESYLINIALAWAVSVATYLGLWTHTGTTATIAAHTSNIGLGPRNPPNPPAPPTQ